MGERNKGRETHLSSLHLVGGHDNDQGVLLPHHAPEVVHCSWQAALRGYVVTVAVYGLSTDVIGVDVIRANYIRVPILQHHTSVVNFVALEGGWGGGECGQQNKPTIALYVYIHMDMCICVCKCVWHKFVVLHGKMFL